MMLSCYADLGVSEGSQLKVRFTTKFWMFMATQDLVSVMCLGNLFGKTLAIATAQATTDFTERCLRRLLSLAMNRTKDGQGSFRTKRIKMRGGSERFRKARTQQCARSIVCERKLLP